MGCCLAKYSCTNPICFLIRAAKSSFKLGNHRLLPVQGGTFAWNHTEPPCSTLPPPALTPPPALGWAVPSPLWILGYKAPEPPQRAPRACRALQHKFLSQPSPLNTLLKPRWNIPSLLEYSSLYEIFQVYSLNAASERLAEETKPTKKKKWKIRIFPPRQNLPKSVKVSGEFA